MILIVIDTLIYAAAALLAVLHLRGRRRGPFTWIALGAINFAALSALEWAMGGPGALLRLSVGGLPVVQILKQCGTGFFLAAGLYAARGERAA